MPVCGIPTTGGPQGSNSEVVLVGSMTLTDLTWPGISKDAINAMPGAGGKRLEA